MNSVPDQTHSKPPQGWKYQIFLAIGVPFIWAAICFLISAIWPTIVDQAISRLGLVRLDTLTTAVEKSREENRTRLGEHREETEGLLSEFDHRLEVLDTDLEQVKEKGYSSIQYVKDEISRGLDPQEIAFLTTNASVDYFERTRSEEVLATIQISQKSVAIITAYTTAQSTGQGKPVLGLEVKLDGRICGRNREVLDRRRQAELYTSVTCVRKLDPRNELYNIHAARTGENLASGTVELAYLVIREHRPEL